MGDIWLHDLPHVLAAAGLEVRTWPGWEVRSRSSGGFDALHGIVVHHTASNTTADNDCAYNFVNASIRPIGNVLLERTGRVTVGAAGASNHAGKGGPWGPVPVDQGNRYLFGIEAQNDGRGEVWPSEMIDAYPRLCAAIVSHYGPQNLGQIGSVGNVMAHFEWAPGRKVDPSGPPSPFARPDDPYLRWNMDEFRGAVWNIVHAPPPPPPPVVDPGLCYPVTEALQPVSWWEVWRRTHDSPPSADRVQLLIDANGGDPTIRIGDLLRIPGRLP